MQNPPTRAALDQLLRQLPATADDLLATTRSLEARGQVVEAIDLLKAAARVSPDARFDTMLGTLLMKLGRHKEALVPLIAVLKQQPQHHPTMLMVCESLIECGELERALGMLQQAERAGAPLPHIQNLRQLAAQRQRELSEGSLRRGPMEDPSASMYKSRPLDSQTRSQLRKALRREEEDDRTEAIQASSFEATSVLGHDARTSMLPPGAAPHLNDGRTSMLPPGAAPHLNDGRTAALPADVLRAHQHLMSPDTSDRTAAMPAGALPPGMLGGARREDATLARPASASLLDQSRDDDGETRAVARPNFMRPGAPFGGRLPEDPSQSGLMTAHLPADVATGMLSPDAIPFTAHEQRGQPSWAIHDEAPRADAHYSGPSFDDPVTTELPDLEEDEPLLGRPNAFSTHGADELYDPMRMSAGMGGRDELFGRAEDLYAFTGPDASSAAQPQWGQHPPQAPHQPQAPQHHAPQQPMWQQAGMNQSGPQPHYHAPSGLAPRAPEPAQQRPGGPPALSELSSNIELAIELPQRNAQGTAERPPERPAAEPAPKQSRSADIAQRIKRGRASSASSGSGPSGAVIGAAIGVGAVLVAYLVLFIADRGLRQDVQGHLSAANQLQATDTYKADVEALDRLDRAQEATSFLGASVDGFVQSSLPSLPGLSAQRMRKQALVEAAVVAARLEDRYAADGAYNAAERVDRAAKAAGADHAQVMGARSYVMREASPLEALAMAQKARLTQPNSSYVMEVYADLLLGIHQVESASKAVATLREMKLPQARQQYLLARISAMQGKKEAALQLRKLLDGLSQQHMDARIALAETMIWSAEDHPRAASLLDEALSADDATVPKCQKARAEAVRGRLLYRQEERREALGAMRRAASLCPERAEGMLALVDFLLDTGAFKEARATLDQQQGEGAKAHEIVLRRARLAQMTSRAQEGIDALASAPQEDPRVHWLRGQLYLDLGDYERAALAFSAGAERDPMLGAQEAWGRIARAKKGESPDAATLDALDRLASKAEQSAPVQRAAGVMRLLLAPAERDVTKRQDMLAQAKKRLDAASRLAPDDALIYYDLCQLQLMRRSKDAARGACEQAQQLGGQYVPGMMYVAQMWLMQGAWSQSEELLKVLQAEHPDDFQIGAMLVRTYIVGGRLDRAQEALDAWLKQPGGKTPQFKLLQGLIAFNMHDFAAAQGYLQQAAQAMPQDAEAAIFLAYAKLRTGEQGAPVEDVLKAQLRHPQWGGFAWLALGELRRRQGRFQDAEENLEQALTTLKEGMTPPWMIGEAYLQRALAWQARYGWGHKQVKQYLDDAAGQGDSGSPELAYVRGLYLLNQKKPQLDAAAVELERSLSAAPKNCATLQALSLTYSKLRRDEELARVQAALEALGCER